MAVKDDVRIYPDMVKVRVALDNGEILGFDAVGYIMNHEDDRVIHKPKLTEEEARERVNTEFDVRSSRLAVIPSRGRRYSLLGIHGQVWPDDYIVHQCIDRAGGADTQGNRFAFRTVHYVRRAAHSILAVAASRQEKAKWRRSAPLPVLTPFCSQC